MNLETKISDRNDVAVSVIFTDYTKAIYYYCILVYWVVSTILLFDFFNICSVFMLSCLSYSKTEKNF